MILESDQVVGIRAQVLAPELYGGVRHAPGARIGQAHRFHGTKAERFRTAARQFLERQAGFKKAGLLKGTEGVGLGGKQRPAKALVLGAIEWAVEVVVRTLAVARPGIDLVALD